MTLDNRRCLKNRLRVDEVEGRAARQIEAPHSIKLRPLNSSELLLALTPTLANSTAETTPRLVVLVVQHGKFGSISKIEPNPRERDARTPLFVILLSCQSHLLSP